MHNIRKTFAFFGAVALILSTMLAPQAAFAAPVVHTVAEIDAPLNFGDYFWDEEGVPRRGKVRVVVDLNAEQIYVYRGGYEIARAKVLRGWDKYKTPVGTFKILEKDADHYSSTYDNAPMPFNLRLTWKGVAIHGSDVDDISATHGCVGIPLEFARTLFKNVRVGDPVLITKNWMPNTYG
ncbi:MAG: L,D-transpeptidase family protein [Sphingorhabdus sp.]